MNKTLKIALAAAGTIIIGYAAFVAVVRFTNRPQRLDTVK